MDTIPEMPPAANFDPARETGSRGSPRTSMRRSLRSEEAMRIRFPCFRGTPTAAQGAVHASLAPGNAGPRATAEANLT